MKKFMYSLLAFFVVMLVGGEVYLRCAWGFCDAVLMQSDPGFEYVAQPAQERYRFKKHIRYNRYSQRSEPVDSSAVIVLGLGDSVINGGTLTDQDSLATTLLGASLSSAPQKVQVLNISAGSWGPDNCAAYLDRYGLFTARAAFLICSSHDAHDIMTHQQVVGVDASFPETQSLFAWQELLVRYLLPRFLPQTSSSSVAEVPAPAGIVKGDSATPFNLGFARLADRFRSAGIPFFIWLHPESAEVAAGAYNSQGEEIICFCKEDSIPLIQGLGYMHSGDYRDVIHVNEGGQYKLAAEIRKILQTYAY